jgi:hypothetical protein
VAAVVAAAGCAAETRARAIPSGRQAQDDGHRDDDPAAHDRASSGARPVTSRAAAIVPWRWP